MVEHFKGNGRFSATNDHNDRKKMTGLAISECYRMANLIFYCRLTELI